MSGAQGFENGVAEAYIYAQKRLIRSQNTKNDKKMVAKAAKNKNSGAEPASSRKNEPAPKRDKHKKRKKKRKGRLCAPNLSRSNGETALSAEATFHVKHFSPKEGKKRVFD